MPESTDSLRAFYLQRAPSLDPIHKPAWRQFRFVLSDGRFFKVPDVIRKQSNLQKWLVQKSPSDVYYTVGRFLRPEKLGPRTETVSENLFLGADLAFDIDHEPFCNESIDAARKDCLNLVDWLVAAKVPIRYLAFSGSKGFHVVCEDPFDYSEASPIDREINAKEKRKIVADRVLEQGIPIDAKVTVDTRRILRLPGTINSKTGYACRVLNLQELNQPAEEILNNTPRVSDLAFPIRKEMTDTLQVLRNSVGLHRSNARSGPSFHYATYLSSNVVGTQLCVPLIVYPRSATSFFVQTCLRETQLRFNLSDFFLFKGRAFFALGLDALQPGRVLKILRFAKSANASFFEKKKRAFVQVSPSIDQNGRVIASAPDFVMRVPGVTDQKKVSRSHLAFLEACGINVSSYSRNAGLPQYDLSHALVES